jgi:phosphodiesterase/alkaline phosphatase D-like protein
LRGVVNPRGASTRYHFQYGRTKRYGSVTRKISAGHGRRAVVAAVRVGGLAPGATYHYRLVATSRRGTTRGADRTFTTAG